MSEEIKQAQFYVSGIHYVDSSSTLHLDTEMEPSVSVSDDTLHLVPTSELDGELLHLAGIKRMHFKIKNNWVIQRLKIMFSKSVTTYTISGRDSLGLDVSNAKNQANVSGNTLNLSTNN